MAELNLFKTLGAKGVIWVLGALTTGIAATWIWIGSQTAWQAHLDRAYVSGILLYDTLHRGARPPSGIDVDVLVPQIQANGGVDILPKFTDLPTPARVTALSIITDPTGTTTGGRLQFHIVSPDLQYPLAKLEPGVDELPAARLGNLARLLATYCSEPVVFGRLDQGPWHRISGSDVWGCGAAPRDTRLFAAALLILSIALLLSRVADTANLFTRFSKTLKRSGQLGGREAFQEEGPQELREIIGTLNEYLALERERLDKRALILSGVSHDLGTPATRLRLRTALIEDEELRSKLEVDIDQMTGIIESVLTYTRSEINSEEPREVSLTSLVQSVVADYEDVGQPVTFVEGPKTEFDQGRSVFGGGRKNLTLSHEDTRRVLVNIRPISLQRAISNLIDNALKYGRKAAVSLQTNSEMARIIIEDEGAGISAEALNELTGPFQRGENSGYVSGVGLGLTIVATIAHQHGGSVNFDKTNKGTRATLTIKRR